MAGREQPQFAGSFFKSWLAALGKTPKDLNGIINSAANSISGGEIALALDVS